MDTPASFSHKLRPVEVASLRLRRVYRVLRETLRAMSGHVSSAPRLQTKRLLAKHAWIDAQHADALRSRVLELRYPRVDVEDGIPPAWLELLARVAGTVDEAEFLAGIYHVVKPRVRAELAAYLAGSDAIDDAPSLFLLNRILPEIDAELAEAEEEFLNLPEDAREKAAAWTEWLDACFEAIGGFDPASLDAKETLPVRPGLSDRAPFRTPAIPARDPSYEPAVMQVPPRAPRNDVESRIWLAMDHANENWAGEVPAALAWEYPAISWELLRDTTRWAYDEMRHAMMGERRLVGWGFRPGIDYPLVSDHLAGLTEGGFNLKDAILLLHALELSGPKWKASLVGEFLEVRDEASSTDCDYDWADEAGHIRIGLEWTRALFPGMSKRDIIERHAMLKDYWANWMKRRHADGSHGWERFLPRVEALAEKLAASENSGHGKPANISYGGTDIFDFEMKSGREES